MRTRANDRALPALPKAPEAPKGRSAFPHVARSHLHDLQSHYRHQWRHDNAIWTQELHWLVPGSVWAVDFTQTPVSIDDDYSYILVVRDLASYYQLLALPTRSTDAAIAVSALRGLFLQYGPPLVNKSDNGSAFIAKPFTQLLEEFHVTALLSPPHLPRYNGATEAGMGPLKVRATYEAMRHGRLGHWTCDDVETARLLGNLTSHPWGTHNPTPQQRWDHRPPLTHDQRAAFRQRLADCRPQVLRELGLAGDDTLTKSDRATVARSTTRRALQALGYLSTQRRRITPPFTFHKRDIIS